MSKISKYVVRSIAIIILLLAVFISTVSAGTWYVDDDGGADFTSIQDAIDAAIADDTIIIKDGTYNENVDVNKRLKIRSEKGPDSSIVLASDPNNHVFNVTVDYVNLSGFTVAGARRGRWTSGIYLTNVEHCTISNNIASNNNYGITLAHYSSNNTLTGNTVNSNKQCGINVGGFSSNITIMNNTASNNGYSGIKLIYSSNNTLMGNIANSNKENGIYVSVSSNNTLTNNTASNNDDGIHLFSSRNNTLANNIANSNNLNGILLLYSSNNIFKGNVMADNRYNFGGGGSRRPHYTHNIDTSNTVDGKPIYYWVDQRDKQIPDDAGYVAVINSTNILVNDLVLTNNFQGILFVYTNNSKIESINCSNNKCGIYLSCSSNNALTNNTANSNEVDGIYLSRSNNNTLIDNTANSNNNGIYLLFSSNNSIKNNNLSSNMEYGIYLSDSDVNTITNNEGTVHKEWSTTAIILKVLILASLFVIVFVVIGVKYYKSKGREAEEVKFCDTCGVKKRELGMEKASAGRRFGSYILDEIIIITIAFVLGVFCDNFWYDSNVIELITYLFVLLIFVGYYTYFFGNGQTTGMKAAKIKLCGTDGTYPMGYGKGFLRLFGMIISIIALGLGFLWILLDKNKQGWHDKIANTFVIKE